MTSSRDPDPYSDLIDHDDTLGLNIAADIEAIHAVPIPAHNFDPSAGRAPRPIRLVRHWRPLALAGAAAVLLATVAFIPSTWGGETERASAQEILDRATEQAVAPRSRSGESYHFIATFTVGKGTGHSTETWYADPTHLRTENLSPDGAVFGLAHDGDRSWMYMTTKGGLRAASFPYEPILVDPFAAGSLAEVLATYSSDGCQEAVDGGQETVLGRRAYLVRVRPTLDTCEVKPAERVKLEGESGELRVWVDAETFLTLRVEKDSSDGSLGYRYEVTTLEVGGIDAADAAYTPPAGAEVAHLDSGGDAKSFIAGVSGSGQSAGEGKQPDIPKKPNEP